MQVVARPDEIVVRVCGADDRVALERLGHPPAVAAILCPSPARRLAWRLSGTRAVSVVARERGTGGVLGCVQFLRSRRSRETWMFGHWRVAAASRRRGIGRRLLREGIRQLPDARRLYSYVEWDNEGSQEAHARLGFEAGRTLRGSATLGALTTVGAATPALRLDPVRASDWGRPVRALRPHHGRSLAEAPSRHRTAHFPSRDIGRTARHRRRGGPRRAGWEGGRRGGWWCGRGRVPWSSPTPTSATTGCWRGWPCRSSRRGRAVTTRSGCAGCRVRWRNARGRSVFQELMGMPDVRTQWRD